MFYEQYFEFNSNFHPKNDDEEKKIPKTSKKPKNTKKVYKIKHLNTFFENKIYIICLLLIIISFLIRILIFCSMLLFSSNIKKFKQIQKCKQKQKKIRDDLEIKSDLCPSNSKLNLNSNSNDFSQTILPNERSTTIFEPKSMNIEHRFTNSIVFSVIDCYKDVYENKNAFRSIESRSNIDEDDVKNMLETPLNRSFS